MKKTLEPADNGFDIHTVNGVDTRTGAVYVKELRTYSPLPNGFNAELGEHIWSIIDTRRDLWNQGVWRKVLWNGDVNEEERDLVRSMLAFEMDEDSPACGTAMCFAGWGAELTAADFVMDRQALLSPGNYSAYAEYIVVTNKVAEQLHELNTYEVETFDFYNRLADDTINRLEERGFTNKTHRLTTVLSYALWQLGLRDGDYLDLFGGENTLEMIRARLDAYTRFGPEQDDTLAEWFGYGDTNRAPADMDELVAWKQAADADAMIL